MEILLWCDQTLNEITSASDYIEFMSQFFPFFPRGELLDCGKEKKIKIEVLFVVMSQFPISLGKIAGRTCFIWVHTLTAHQ